MQEEDKEQIRLIVTDMDGTFLNSRHEKSPEFTKVYQALKERNIVFVPASGRQMAGITAYFEDIKNDIGFIAENGGYMIYRGKEIFVDEMNPKYIAEIIRAVREIPKARAVLSAKNFAYYESRDQEFVDFFTNYYLKNQYREDLTEPVDDGAFKIAVYHPEGSEEHLYPYLKHFDRFGLKVVVSGEFWLDIMNADVNKGTAVKALQQYLNITPAQTMAFGDYMNDIEMLRLARYNFAMENAHPDVKKIAEFCAPSNDEFGVLKVIENFFKDHTLKK